MKKEVTKAWIPKKGKRRIMRKVLTLLWKIALRERGSRIKGKGKLEDDTEGRRFGDPCYNKENVGTSNMFNILESVVEREEGIGKCSDYTPIHH